MTRGEAINARASAGARMVEAREALERCQSHHTAERDRLNVAFIVASVHYDAARLHEQRAYEATS